MPGVDCVSTGKMRIVVRNVVRILPVQRSADPHVRILPPANGILLRQKIPQLQLPLPLLAVLPSVRGRRPFQIC